MIALIAHDQKKSALVRFVAAHSTGELLGREL
jgi:methylglyoxal synthase